MNIYQKAVNKAVIENIRLFPKFEGGSFYRRRKLIRKVSNLPICGEDEFDGIVEDGELHFDDVSDLW